MILKLMLAIAGLFLISGVSAKEKGTLYFSDQPFVDSNDTAKSKSAFKAGDQIYGMIVMSEKFGEYVKHENLPLNVVYYAALIPTKGKSVNAYTSVGHALGKSYHDKNYLLFDVSPEPARAITHVEPSFMRIGHLLAEVKRIAASQNEEPKLGFNRRYEVSFKLDNTDIATTTLDIDYTNATKESMKTWNDREEKAALLAKNNSAKMQAANAAGTAATLPLPRSFSETGGNGYSDPKLSSTNIMAMLKKKDEVKSLLKFMFLKTTAGSDFILYKTPLGAPDYQWGNRYFQFIFKDANGKCLASGGRIKMIHEGGGRYSAPIIIWEYADVARDEKHEKDSNLKAYVVDCSKVKS
jgi:hypothetical protein